MKIDWYVVYKTCYLLEPAFTYFVAGFAEEEDAKSFLKRKNRKNADSIRKGQLKFFIEKHPFIK